MRHYGFQIENELFWAGVASGWEKTSLSLWMRLTETSEVIFDIGANTGVYSLMAGALNSNAKVFAFEPVSRVFDKLKTNVEMNGFNISCEEVAVSNTDGTATIYDTPTDHVLSVTVNANLQSPATEVIPTEVRTLRLDTFIRKHALEKVDLLKVDVETHEPEVLEGFGEYLNEFRPSMLIEILDDSIGHRVQEQVEGLGYLYFNIDENKDSIRPVDRIGKSDYYNFFICKPSVASSLGLATG